jgi:prophage DNA circulation protein
MSWRDQMGPATFRGVPFFVDTAERSGGRRTVKHEYPNRDDPFIEDMGRRAGSYPVEGYVLGADYLAARNALIAALETEGPGELVHPYYGTLRVICSTFRVREAAGEGGVARLSIEFEQTTATPIQPTAVPDAGRLVISSANAAALAVAAEFQESFDPSGLPGSSLDSAIAMVKSAGAAVDSAMGPIVTDEQALADLKRKISALSDAAVSLVRTPADLAASVLDVFATLNDIATIPGRAVASLLAAYGFTPSADRPPATTSTRAREQANYDAAQRFGQRMMIVQAARLAPAQTYDSYNAAVGVALAIALKLDAQLELAG